MNKLRDIASRLCSENLRTSSDSFETESSFGDLPSSRDNAAGKLKGRLLEQYRDVSLLEATGFEKKANDYGQTLHLREFVEESFVKPDTSAEDILSDLKLVRGIGSVREKRLKEEGFTSIDKLIDHRRWGQKAEWVCQTFREKNLTEAYHILRRWKSLSHPLLFKLAGMVDKEKFAVVDIETLGLSNQPIFLVGLVRPNDSGVLLHQFLAADLNQELATVMEFCRLFEELQVVVSYNGRQFDLPYIERRLAYYGNRRKFSHPHLDLYLFARKVFGDQLRNCQLSTIERFLLGVNRQLDIPSSLVPEFYRAYREEKNPGPLLPILAHNRQDLLSLVGLFAKLHEELLNGR